jgi:KaiC/GvpD/RAD55 family RecA-like ATPase
MVNENNLINTIQKYKEGVVIMMELPTDNYFELNTQSVISMMSQSYNGIYISFQRPFKNISSLLEQKGVDISKLYFIDVATAFAEEEQEKNLRCLHISSAIDVDELVRAIYTTINKLKGEKCFIFMDSLTTITLYKPLSELLRLSEFLIRTVKINGSHNVVLILNVAKDLAQKKFIKDIAFRVDEVITM